MGPRNLATPAHFVLGPRPALRREKCPRTHEKSPNVLETMPRTILSSTLQTPEGKDGTPSKASSQSAPRRKDEHRRTHTGVWCESNSRRSCHLHIECT